VASPIDFFCTPGDQHQVRLLVQFLEGLGLELTLRTASHPDPTDPALVAWTARAERAGWPAQLLAGGGGRIALQLDDTGLPLATIPAVDLRRWPARSADAAATSLASRLLAGAAAAGAGAAVGPGAPPHREQVAVAGSAPLQTRAPGPGESSAERPRTDPDVSGSGPSRRRRDWQSVLVPALLLLLLGGLIYWLSVPGPAGDDEPGEDPPPEAPRPGTAGSVPGPAGDDEPGEDPPPEAPRPGTAGSDPGSPVASPAPVLDGAAATTAAARNREEVGTSSAGRELNGSLTAELQEGAGSRTTAAPAAPELPTAPSSDSLAHLCRAVNGEAAYGWALALDWRQRQAALTEPCVQALAARPAFGELARWLAEQRAMARERARPAPD